MFRKFQALRLIVRADPLTVHGMRPRQHFFVNQSADDLAMLENERHFARAYLQYGARALAAGAGIAEAWIEEAGIMHAEFTDQRIERNHLGSIVRRHLHRFLGGENVEFAGIENKAAVGPPRNWLPELVDLITPAAVDIDDAGVALGAITDEAAGLLSRKIDAQRHAIGEIGVIRIDEPLELVQRTELSRIEGGFACAEANLREARTLAQQHRKGLRTDFGIERTVIAGANHVEAARAVGDHAGEDIEPSGRTLGVRGGDDFAGQGQRLQQRHDVN